jgi:mRNA interferase RelE/StbE
MASFKVEFTKSSTRDLRGIDRQWIPRIIAAVESLAEDPRPSGCKKLVGADFTYRIRIGDYRVIYEILDDSLLILVVKIRHRRDAYR